jgi:hypothetical protein
MTNPKRRRSSRRRSKARNRRSSNPRSSKRFSFRRRHRGRSRNPAIAGFQANELLKLAVGAAGGAIGTKYITQLVLQDKNTGVTGYAGMAAVAIALAWAAKKFVGADIAAGVAAGGLSSLVIKLWQDQVSGTSSMSGLGDADMLGLYQPGNYPVPFWQYGSPALAAPTAAATITPASLMPSKRSIARH